MIGATGRMMVLGVASGISCASVQCQELMTLDFSWQGISGCAGYTLSPAFFVRNAPLDTHTLSFALFRGNREYGGEQASYPASGNVAPGLIHTMGPCVPGDYRWSVVALDRLGKPLATADRTRSFP